MTQHYVKTDACVRYYVVQVANVSIIAGGGGGGGRGGGGRGDVTDDVLAIRE